MAEQIRMNTLRKRHGRRAWKVNRRLRALRAEMDEMHEPCRRREEDLEMSLSLVEEFLRRQPAIVEEVSRAEARGFLGRLWWGIRFAWTGRVVSK